jgi:glucose 1-dehydrogenase
MLQYESGHEQPRAHDLGAVDRAGVREFGDESVSEVLVDVSEQHAEQHADPAWEMGAAAFLCSDDAAYITGQTLFIDGGLTLSPDFRTCWSSE